MKKILVTTVLLCVCSFAKSQDLTYRPFFRDLPHQNQPQQQTQGIVYTPFIRETTPIPQYQPSFPQPPQHNPAPAHQVKATVECVKNCIAMLPKIEQPIVVHVHVKQFIDSNRSFGFVEPNSGTFCMFGNATDGLEQLVPTKAVDPSMAEDWPYFVVFNTNAGEIICFLPNLYTSKIAVYDFESFHKQ